MTADGKIATANRVLSSFGSARDHEHLLELRATADAVMAGARTVDLNSINLGPGPLKFRRRRLQRGLTEYNLRIIVSGSGSINPQAEIFKHRFADANNPLSDKAAGRATEYSDGRAVLPLPRRVGEGWGEGGTAASRPILAPPLTLALSPSEGERETVPDSCRPTHRFLSNRLSKSPILILTTARASASALRRLRRLADDVKVCGKTEINFRTALRWLCSHWGVKRLLCEGGGELNDALFRAGLVDELHLTVCPKIFGGRTAPTIADGLGIPKLANTAPLKLKSARQVGDEMFLVFERV